LATLRSSQIFVSLFLSLALLAVASPGRASDPNPLSDTLTGDWLGIRTALKDRGIDLTTVYTSETAYNPQGGQQHSALYTDQISFGLAFDLQKLLKLNDAEFQISITDRNGHNLSGTQNLGTLQQVQELYGRGQTWLITQFWYRQSYFNNIVDWKIGRMTMGEDFASFSCEFMNLTFCGAPPGNIVGNYWYNWPISQWASRVRVALGTWGYFQVGGYVSDQNYLLQRYAFTLAQPPGATGALIPVEFGWLPHLGQNELPGSYRIGAWDNTSQSNDVFENTRGQPLLTDGGTPRTRNGAYGVYLNVLQQLIRGSADSRQGLNIFFNATFADRRTSMIDNQLAIGLTYTGFFASRPRDDVAIAFGRTHVNSRVTQAEEMAQAAGIVDTEVQTAEYVTELYYSVHPTRWLMLRPNFQYIHRPGGVDARTDDIVLGLKAIVRL
jgi:porin